MRYENININEYNYGLPEDKIAKFPLEERTDSKILIYDKGKIRSEIFKNLPDILQKNDLLIFNTTKVIRARLIFKKPTGAKIEIFCLEPYEPYDYQQIFEQTKKCKWHCAVGNLKKWKNDNLEKKVNIKNQTTVLKATKIKTENNDNIIEFSWDNPDFTFADILENEGIIPIPPYLKRETEDSDKIRYQTVYSKQKGSVAAPTAGLHFTDKLIKKLKSSGIKTAELTLHVGAGTFKPVKTELISEHEMHTEHFTVSKKLIEELIEDNGNITAVGTTSVRTLESLYQIGVKLEYDKNPEKFSVSQWEAYNLPDKISTKKALKNISEYLNEKNKEYLEANTRIMIVPGYEFKIVKKLITNFHQPKSTLLLLIAAFIGDDWKNVYDYALKNNFRFLSYGDSSILIP